MDELRTFECSFEDGPERVTIKDVLVWDDTIHLVVQGRQKLYVFKVLPRGIQIALKDETKLVLQLHEEELLRFQSAQPKDEAHVG